MQKLRSWILPGGTEKQRIWEEKKKMMLNKKKIGRRKNIRVEEGGEEKEERVSDRERYIENFVWSEIMREA